MVKRKLERKKVFYTLGIILTCLLLALLAIFILENRGYINLFNDKDSPSEAKTTSQAPTAQSDFSDGGDREPVSQNNASSSSVGDNSGVISPSTPTNDPIASTSGEISVYAPSRNMIISSGQEIAGASSLNSVTFRIIDDVQGVTSSGELKVVNGKFSGRIDVTTTASQGRIDIFGARSDGTEFSNVEIPVRYK